MGGKAASGLISTQTRIHFATRQIKPSFRSFFFSPLSPASPLPSPPPLHFFLPAFRRCEWDTKLTWAPRQTKAFQSHKFLLLFTFEVEISCNVALFTNTDEDAETIGLPSLFVDFLLSYCSIFTQCQKSHPVIAWHGVHLFATHFAVQALTAHWARRKACPGLISRQPPSNQWHNWQFWVFSYPHLCVFWLRVEAGMPRENPHNDVMNLECILSIIERSELTGRISRTS